MDILLPLLSGGMLILSFPKFNCYLLAYVALVPLLVCLKRSRSTLHAMIYGFMCGLIYMGGVLFWVNILSRWAGLWVNLAWLALAVFQAVFIAIFSGAYKISFDKYPKYSLLAAPLLWVFIEWIRSLGPYGVTGGGLGYSQTELLPILQVASIASVYGISFIIVMVNEAITKTILERKARYLALAILVLLASFLFGYYRISTFRESGKPIEIAVIQANIDQDVKMDFGLAFQIVDTHENMSRKALSQHPDLVIWPETAVTTYLLESNKILPGIRKLVRESGAYYLIGTPYREKDKIYNSVVAFSKAGELIGRYDKQRLVPFGEYLPLRPLFYSLLQENPLFAEDYNGDPRPAIIDIGIAKVGVVICFESTLPYMVRDRVRRGAQFILVATNDAWFFDTAACYQHIQAARLRAVENNMYVVQAANTGISAIIDPLGRVVMKSDVGQPTVMIGKVYVH